MYCVFVRKGVQLNCEPPNNISAPPSMVLSSSCRSILSSTSHCAFNPTGGGTLKLHKLRNLEIAYVEEPHIV
jgi:hypothetical protein